MSKPTFRIAYQHKRRAWRLQPNEHTHPALYPELEQAVDYAIFRCPPGGALLRIKDETGEISESEIESEGSLCGYFEQAD